MFILTGKIPSLDLQTKVVIQHYTTHFGNQRDISQQVPESGSSMNGETTSCQFSAKLTELLLDFREHPAILVYREVRGSSRENLIQYPSQR